MGRHVLPVFFCRLLNKCKLQDVYLYNIYVNIQRKEARIMSDIEYRYLLNRCLRADFSKYNREYGYLAHLYATDINAYNDVVMQLANGSAVVTM